jgi:nicotinamidase-related amidase
METRKTALIVVDVQPDFITKENNWILPNIGNLLRDQKYDAYVEAVFSAPKGSLWDKQMNWTFPKQDTVSEIKALIPTENYLFIEKETKSVFKGDQDVVKFLKENNIEEIHVVGLDTNDCIIATAYEAFDLGFFTYVVENCTASSQSPELRENATKILMEQDMLL